MWSTLFDYRELIQISPVNIKTPPFLRDPLSALKRRFSYNVIQTFNNCERVSLFPVILQDERLQTIYEYYDKLDEYF